MRFEGETGVTRAVDGVSLDVPAGSVITLLGPSGCGKTTTLRCLAGLERPQKGTIHIGNRTVVDTEHGVFLAPHKRRVGMVFQSYAIWPHMTVAANVKYPLQEIKITGSDAKARTQAALELVGLPELGNRLAPNLSGGQQQRVALARALVAEPQVLLLDEPLSNLDAKLRESMRGELRTLQQRLGITAVYVTHDQLEALAISDVIAVMDSGKIVEMGSPRELYDHPKTRVVANFLGATNALARCPHGHSTTGRSGTADAILRCVRPDDVKVSREAGSFPNGEEWEGVVETSQFLGSMTRCEVRVGTDLIFAEVPRAVDVATGDQVYVGWEHRFCIPVTADGMDPAVELGSAESAVASG